MKHSVSLGAIVALSLSTIALGETVLPDAPPPIPSHPSSRVFPPLVTVLPEPVGTYRNTHYYVALERRYENDPKDAVLLTMQDQILVEVSSAFKRALEIEGSGRLMDGRVINYAGFREGSSRWAFTVHPYGRGAGNCPLIPFRTVAMDRRKVPLGSVAYIDETVGMTLPDGTIHDGFWRVEDVGGAIKEDRVDLFVGDGNQGAVLRRHGITHLMPLTVRLVEGPEEVGSCVRQSAR